MPSAGDITVIKTLKAPPEEVKSSIKATLLILGHTESQVKEWKYCLACLNKKRDESILRKMSEFDATKCSSESASAAERLLKGITTKSITSKCKAAHSFFLWANEKIQEVPATCAADDKNEGADSIEA